MDGAEADSPYVYLELEEVLVLYAEIKGLPISAVADELRDRNGLGSALARSQQAAKYAQADLAAQAATLLWGIAETQAFVDGNKRIALVVTLTFLGLNGYAVQLSEDERVQLLFDIADGMTVDEVAAFLRPRLAAAAFDDLEDGLE